jgi:hypothetical protein
MVIETDRIRTPAMACMDRVLAAAIAGKRGTETHARYGWSCGNGHRLHWTPSTVKLFYLNENFSLLSALDEIVFITLSGLTP